MTDSNDNCPSMAAASAAGGHFRRRGAPAGCAGKINLRQRIWNAFARGLRATLGRCLGFLLFDCLAKERRRTEKLVADRLKNYQRRNPTLVTLQKMVKVHAVNKERCAYEMWHERGLAGTTGMDEPGGVVVSLTSYPGRIYDVHYAIHSLLRQSIRPERVVLWLGEDRFPGREDDLPGALLDLRRRGLEIRFCEDLGAFTKLVPALSAFPGKTIVTADDDIFYPENWLEALVRAHRADPETIWCRRVRTMALAPNGDIAPCRLWKVNLNGAEPSFANFLTGVGGVLYPPGSLDAAAGDKAAFRRLTPNNDDIWFWAMAVRKGTRIGAVSDGLPPYLTYVNRWREMGLSGDGTLLASNLLGNANEGQFRSVLEACPDVAEKLGAELAGANRKFGEGKDAQR